MLNRWIAICLGNRRLVAAAAILVAVWGTVVALRTPIDVLPDLDRPTVTILTEAHGLSAEEVESRITGPLEERLGGAPGAARVRSVSGRDFSVVFVEFGWGTDVESNRRAVEERLRLAQPSLPPGIQPRMAPVASIMGQVQFVGVESPSGARSPTELREIADTRILPRLRALPGVAQVLAIGGAPRELQVVVDAAKLREHDVSLADVERAVRGTDPAGAAVPERAAALAAAALPGSRLDDVARVEFQPSSIPLGQAGVNGRPGVVLVVFKQPGVDTVDLTRRVGRDIAAVQAELGNGDVRVVPDLFRQSVFIERSISNIEAAMRDGVLLVVVVLFLFLANVRTTLITLTAIPLSIAVTALVFHASGLTINTMTLGGLAVAIGALVDDSIVDVENVFRRLRQNAASPAPAPSLWIVFKASCEVRNPILIGTLLVVVVYVPLFFLSGMEGRLFTPIGLAYIISTLASLAVSLTVTPALCWWLLGGTFVARHLGDSWMVGRLKRLAGVLIRFGMDHALRVMALLVSLSLISVVVLGTRGNQFLPAFNEGSAQVNMILPPGTSLETSDRFGRRLEEILAGVRGVKSVGRRTGRAEGDEHIDGPNVTEAIVTFDPDSGRRREEIIEEMRKRIAAELPGPATSVEQPLAHLLSHLLSGVNAQVAVKVYGPDLEVLRKTAADIEGALRPIAGVRDLFTEPQILVEEIEARPDPDRCREAGIDVREVRESVEMALSGEVIAQVGDSGIPVVIRLKEEDRRDLEAIRDLPLRAADGTMMRIRDVAMVEPTRAPNQILHEDGTRRTAVQLNVAGRPLDEVVADVEKALLPIRARLASAPGAAIRVSGQLEAQKSASRRIAAFSLVALLAMALILLAHFRSVNLSLQALLCVPAAFIGAAGAVAVTGQTLSVATLVGLISLGGIATRNAILLLDHYLHLMREEGVPFSRDMILRAGQERMVPVLMTALCSGIALAPLVVAPDRPGRELLYPVATVILGGLLTVTLLEFLLTPGIFWLFGRAAAERLSSRPEESDQALEMYRKSLVRTPAAPATIPPKGTPDA